MIQKTFAVDPGSEQSGIVLMQEKMILWAKNVPNEELVSIIRDEAPDIVLIEDIAPYNGRVKQDVINTCKFIGVLEYRLKQAAITPQMIFRWQVKKWVFDTFPKVAIPRIEAKIKVENKKGHLLTESGEPYKPSFVYVDDRIVVAALKERYKIPKPKPGKTSMYGLSTHSWQALSVATYYLDTH